MWRLVVFLSELLKYTVVGGIAFCLDFALLYFLTEWGGWHYLVSASFAFTAGLLLNYTLSVKWVFRFRNYNNKRLEFLIFLAVGLGGLILTDGLLAILTPLLKENYLAAKLITVFFVYLWNFFVRRQLLFSQKKHITL